MNVVDGREVEGRLERECDVVVVGSGPAGATVARDLARRGCSVVIVEQGPWVEPDEMPEDMFEALSMYFRDMAAFLTASWPPMPILQGVAVGGSSVINGSICWRFPEYVHREWSERDPAFADAVPWEQLEADTDQIEEELHVGPTDYAEAGRHNQIMADGAEALGIEHKPTDLNTRGTCVHGMKGCPEGKKMSMDRTYLPEACGEGAEILSCTTATGIEREGGRAIGIRGRTWEGGRVRVRADRAVAVAASAIQTPALLMHSGIRHGPVGENLQAHPGSSVMGLFDEEIRMWEGPTQGHETLALRDEGIKMETLGYNPTLAVMRMKQLGGDLAREVGRLEHWCNGGAAVKAEATGRVRAAANGEAVVSYRPTEADYRKLRRGAAAFGRIYLAAGAERVSLGVPGWHDVTSVDEVETFEQEGPTDATEWEMIISHLFGTCQMGSDPATSVVGLDFEHHTVDRLYVADSSVFPSNTGVNPMISIIAFARQCARRILEG